MGNLVFCLKIEVMTQSSVRILDCKNVWVFATTRQYWLVRCVRGRVIGTCLDVINPLWKLGYESPVSFIDFQVEENRLSCVNIFTLCSICIYDPYSEFLQGIPTCVGNRSANGAEIIDVDVGKRIQPWVAQLNFSRPRGILERYA